MKNLASFFAKKIAKRMCFEPDRSAAQPVPGGGAVHGLWRGASTVRLLPGFFASYIAASAATVRASVQVLVEDRNADADRKAQRTARRRKAECGNALADTLGVRQRILGDRFRHRAYEFLDPTIILVCRYIYVGWLVSFLSKKL
jgi:hypothetical protein